MVEVDDGDCKKCTLELNLLQPCLIKVLSFIHHYRKANEEESRLCMALYFLGWMNENQDCLLLKICVNFKGLLQMRVTKIH